MSKNSQALNKIADFFAGKGFYIILFLCVAAIGISGYVLFFGGSDEPTVPDLGNYLDNRPDIATLPPITTPTADEGALQQDGEGQAVLNPVTVEVDDAAEVAKTATPEPTSTPTAAPTPTPEPTFFVWPLSGAVSQAFSGDELVYNQTMGDWRTHSGMDIAATVGSKVYAIADGTVEEIKSDDMMGTTVVIRHSDALTSVYANLMGEPTVKVGATVKAGDTIGGVGDTAIAESLSASHLHLEVYRDGKAIDPADLLPNVG